MNLNLLLIILIVFNYTAAKPDKDETIANKKIDLKSDSHLESSDLNLDKSNSNLNLTDPSLKNISHKLSSKEEKEDSEEDVNLKKNSERDTKDLDNKEVLLIFCSLLILKLISIYLVQLQKKDNSSTRNHKLLVAKDDLILNGKLKQKTNTKEQTDKHKEDTDTQTSKDTKQSTSTKADDLPSFDEWKKKVVEEEPNNQQNSAVINSSNKKLFQSSSNDNKLRIRNYASSECGAKVINSNKEAQGSYKILSESQDEYMLNPCNSKIWFIIELCEAIKLSFIEVANYELFSSTFRDFLIYGSGHYPTRDWHLLGNFTANDIKQVQVFSFGEEENEFRKFIKIEILSHHGSEHFCPFSLVRMFGTSMTDEFDALDGDKIMNNKLMQDEMELLQKKDDDDTKKNYLNEKSVFYKILKKVAEFFYKNLPERDRKSKTKEENFARFLKDRDTLDAIIEQSIMNMLPTLKPKLEICSNLDKQSRKLRSQRIKYCSYLRTLIGATTFDLLLKEMDKESKLQFKCLLNTNSSALNSELNITDSSKSKKLKIESSIVDKKIDSVKLEDSSDQDSDEINLNSNSDSRASAMHSIKITPSLENEELILPTPTMMSKSNLESSATMSSLEMIKKNEKSDELSKKEEKSIQLEGSSKTQEESIKVDDSSSSGEQSSEQQVKSNEKTIENNQIQSSKGSPLTEDEILPNGTPISGSSSKETIFIRMINKIKTLELNLSLSSQYLEELSQRYRRQMDEMQKNFNQTIFKLNETSKTAAEKDNRQQLLLDRLGSKIHDLEDKLFILISILIAKLAYDLITYFLSRRRS